MNITLNTKDAHDVEILKAIAKACDSYVLSQRPDPEKQETKTATIDSFENTFVMTPKEPESRLQITKDAQESSLIIDARQAESLMGLHIKNIRKNAEVMSDYRAFISPHPKLKGSYIVGEKLIKAMQPSDLATLRAGYNLRVPIALSTSLINSALKGAYPEDPPKYLPWRDGRSGNITVFSCKPENGKVLPYYLTLVKDLKENRPRYHMAIENHFLKRSF